MEKILIIDNYDSFTYNLLHYIEQLVPTKVDVVRNDAFDIDLVARYDKIIFSPGPGLPKHAGKMNEVIKTYAAEKSMLGICLGMQAMAECFGGSLSNLDQVVHGMATPAVICDRNEKLFVDIPDTFIVGRYHSWVVAPQSLSDDWSITSKDKMGNIMSIRHKSYNIRGVQFHPESILTDQGLQMLKNYLTYY